MLGDAGRRPSAPQAACAALRRSAGRSAELGCAPKGLAAATLPRGNWLGCARSAMSGQGLLSPTPQRSWGGLGSAACQLTPSGRRPATATAQAAGRACAEHAKPRHGGARPPVRRALPGAPRAQSLRAPAADFRPHAGVQGNARRAGWRAGQSIICLASPAKKTGCTQGLSRAQIGRPCALAVVGAAYGSKALQPAADDEPEGRLRARELGSRGPRASLASRSANGIAALRFYGWHPQRAQGRPSPKGASSDPDTGLPWP